MIDSRLHEFFRRSRESTQVDFVVVRHRLSRLRSRSWDLDTHTKESSRQSSFPLGYSGKDLPQLHQQRRERRKELQLPWLLVPFEGQHVQQIQGRSASWAHC